MLRYEDIERLAIQAGFDLCGVTPAEHLVEGEARFVRWLERGCGDDLGYLHRNIDLRFDASRLVEGGRSVIVCAVSYKSRFSLEQDLSDGVGVASYALMRDYHKTIKRRLKALLSEIKLLDPEVEGRAFTDSAPLWEKGLAVRAGLGWIGRQSLLITPEYGSFVLLGEIVINREVDRYSDDRVESRCGECRRCVEACPVGAINDDRTIDTRLCIACQTIEVESSALQSRAGWIFGCDLCQQCCPHNRTTPLSTHVDMQPSLTPPKREEWMSMSQEEFERVTAGTPLRRSNLERIRRLIDEVEE